MSSRALVLGGGGPVGLAWESGLVAGFAQAGVDLGRADHVLGTSAGSVVGARLAAGVPAAALADVLLAGPSAAANEGGGPAPDLTVLAALMADAQSGQRNPADVRRELGAFALAAQTGPEDIFVRMIEGWIGVPRPLRWPSSAFACTAVDVGDGGFQLWDEGAGVDLVAAVASSCSAPGVFPPVTVKGRRYMDGGARSATNADMAAGYDLVVVVAVSLPGLGFMTESLEAEVESLKAGGATVVTILPDEEALASFGANLLDFGRSPAVAGAGLAQAARQADILREIWG